MATPRNNGGLTTGSGAAELTAIPLPASARRGSAPRPQPATPTAQAGVSAALSTPAFAELTVPEVPVVLPSMPQRSEQTLSLQSERDAARDQIRLQEEEGERINSQLMEDYVASLSAPMPAMGQRPKIPDMPTQQYWQSALAENMPVYALIAALGAMGTRQPLMNAMGAMTAATVAFRNGSMEEFDREVKRWELESKVAGQRIEEWKDERDRILNDRNKSIEQRKALLEVHSKGLGNAYRNNDRRLNDYQAAVEESIELDNLVSQYNNSVATIQNSASQLRARLGFDASMADRSYGLALAKDARAAADSENKNLLAQEQILIQRARLELAKANTAIAEDKLKYQQEGRNLERQALELKVKRLEKELVIMDNKEERDAKAAELKNTEDQIKIKKLEQASTDFTREQRGTIKDAMELYERNTKDVRELLREVDLARKLVDDPLGGNIATNILTSLTRGRTTTNYQIQSIQNYGPVVARIEQAVNRFWKGTKTEAATREFKKVLDEVDVSLTEAIKVQQGKVFDRMIHAFPQPEQEPLRRRAYGFVVGE